MNVDSREARRMNMGKAGVVLGVPVLLLGGLAGCGSDEAQAVQGEAEFRRVINVEVQELSAEPFEERVRIVGVVQAAVDVTISAEEVGVIRELPVERGTVVREGDLLARVDDRLLQAQLQEAQAVAELAREVWERRQRLYEGDRVGAELPYLEARYSHEQAQAALTSLQERLSRTEIRAPMDGILEERLVEVGTMVTSGTPVARMVQVDPVKVVGGVPERFAPEIRTGAAARITFDVLPGEVFDGRVGFVGATVNPHNRTFDVELRIPNRNRVIKPEMVANVEVTRRNLDGALVVPQDAVVRVEEGFVAFVAVQGEGGTFAEVRPVEVSTIQRNFVLVRSGLEAGDRLIVVGQKQVAHGDRIQVVRERETRNGGGNR